MEVKLIRVLGLQSQHLPFFDRICDVLISNKKAERIYDELKLLFSVKLTEKGVPFDYGWVHNGLQISYFNEVILFVECDTDFLEKDDN